jgi:nitrite reductase (NADH) small subunit
MGEHLVGNVNEFEGNKIKVVNVKGKSIGVYEHNGNFYSMLNYCPHQGGPLCEGGKLFPKIDAEVTSKGKVREFHDCENVVVSCPLHGWEFDAKSGVCLADAKRKVPTYQVKTEGDKVYLVLPERK